MDGLAAEETAAPLEAVTTTGNDWATTTEDLASVESATKVVEMVVGNAVLVEDREPRVLPVLGL